MASSAMGLALTGKRLRVRWPDDDAWYLVTVTAYSSRRGHCLKYDHVPGEDDRHEFEDLTAMDWEHVSPQQEPGSTKSERKRPQRAVASRPSKAKRRATADSDDDYSPESAGDEDDEDDEDSEDEDEDASHSSEEQEVPAPKRRPAASSRTPRPDFIYETAEFFPYESWERASKSHVLKWGLGLKEKHLDGKTYVQVDFVDRGSGAEAAGVKPKRLILSINGTPCDRGEQHAVDILRAAKSKHPKQHLTLELRSVLKHNPEGSPRKPKGAGSSVAAVQEPQSPPSQPPRPPTPPTQPPPPPPTEAPEWAIAAIAPDAEPPKGTPRHHQQLDALEELLRLPAALLVPHAGRLLPSLCTALAASSMANVRLSSLECVARLGEGGVRLDAHLAAVVGRLHDDCAKVVHMATVLVDEHWGPEPLTSLTGESHRLLLNALFAVISSEPHWSHGKSNRVAVSWALDHAFGMEPALASVKGPDRWRVPLETLATVGYPSLAPPPSHSILPLLPSPLCPSQVDLHQLELTVNDDLEATRNWRASQRSQICAPPVPMRFVHRERRQPTVDSAFHDWGRALATQVRDPCSTSAMTKAKAHLDDLLAPYIKWNTSIHSTIAAARMHQLAHAFTLRPAAGGSSTAAGSSTAEPEVPHAAVRGLVTNVCNLPPERLDSQLPPIAAYLSKGTDPVLLVAAVDLICHGQRKLLLEHVGRLIGWLPRTEPANLRKAAQKALVVLGWTAKPSTKELWHNGPEKFRDEMSGVMKPLHGEKEALLTADLLAPHAGTILSTFLAGDFDGGGTSSESIAHTLLWRLPSTAVIDIRGMLADMLDALVVELPQKLPSLAYFAPPSNGDGIPTPAVKVTIVLQLLSQLPEVLLTKHMDAIWKLIEIIFDSGFKHRDLFRKFLSKLPVAILAECIPSLLKFGAFDALEHLPSATIVEYIPELIECTQLKDHDPYYHPSGPVKVLSKVPDDKLGAHAAILLPSLKAMSTVQASTMLDKLSDESLNAHIELVVETAQEAQHALNSYLPANSLGPRLLKRIAKLEWHSHAETLAPFLIRDTLYAACRPAIRPEEEDGLGALLASLMEQVPPAALGACANCVLGCLLDHRDSEARRFLSAECGNASAAGQGERAFDLDSYPYLLAQSRYGRDGYDSNTSFKITEPRSYPKAYEAAVAVLSRMPNESLAAHAGVLVFLLSELTAKTQQALFRCVMRIDATALAADTSVLSLARKLLLKSSVIQRRAVGLRLILRLISEAPAALGLTELEEDEAGGSSSAFAAPKTRADQLGSDAIAAADGLAPTHEVYKLSERVVQAIENPQGVVGSMYCSQFGDMGFSGGADGDDAGASAADAPTMPPQPSSKKRIKTSGGGSSGGVSGGEPGGSMDVKPTKKPRAKRDPAEPKKGLTAYMLWMNGEGRGEAKAALGEGATVSDLAKWCGPRWKEMDGDARAEWDEMAKADKARYEREMVAYKQARDEAGDVTVPGEQQQPEAEAASKASMVAEGVQGD